MALDARYIPAYSLTEYFVDKNTGEPLAGGKIYTYKDRARATPKNLFELTGTPPNYAYTALPNPLTLSSVGTILNNSNQDSVPYFFPYDDDGLVDNYYIEVYDANNVLQYTREGVPGLTGTGEDTDEGASVTNQISNPNFTRTFLNPGANTFTISGATSIPIAPNWVIDADGSDDIVVQRYALAGNDKVPGSPAYALEINVGNSITQCNLRQRMNTNSGLWASINTEDVYLAGNFVARNEGAGNAAVKMYYADLPGGTPVEIISGSVVTGSYNRYSDFEGPIDASTNSASGEDGYVDVYLELPIGETVRVSAIQIVPTYNSTDALNASATFDENTSNREQAFMGDYFIPAFYNKPQKSYLVGWDFAVNPAQFGESGTITAGAANTAYIWDQTIAASLTNNVTYARNTETSGLQLTTAASSDTPLYVMQYLTGDEVRRMIGKKLSVAVDAYSDKNNVTARVYLYRAEASSSFPTLPTSIVDQNASTGVLSLTTSASTDDWTEIPRSNLNTPEYTLAQITGTSFDDVNTIQGFSQWQITTDAQEADTDKFAIAVAFFAPTASTEIVVRNISLVEGDIPSIAFPKSYYETLEECKYYYEQSANPGVTSFNTLVNMAVASMHFAINSTPATIYEYAAIPIAFKPKVAPPVFQIYAPSNGTVNNVDIAYGTGSTPTISTQTASDRYLLEAAGDLSTTTVTTLGTSNTFLQPKGVGGAAVSNNWTYLRFHYTLDARLGQN